MRNYAHILVGTHNPGENPVAHERIADVHVIVGNNDPLVVARPEISPDGERDLIHVAGVLLLDADPKRRRTASGLESVDVGDARDFQVFPQGLQQAGLEQRPLDDAAFAWRELTEHTEEDRILPMRDAPDVEYRGFTPPRHESGEFAEWAFSLDVIRCHFPLDDIFGGRRYLNVDSFAFDQFNRPPANPACNGPLVLAISRR